METYFHYIWKYRIAKEVIRFIYFGVFFLVLGLSTLCAQQRSELEQQHFLIQKGDNFLENDPSFALRYFESLYQQERQTEDTLFVAHLLNRLGRVNILLGNYSEAIRCLNKAITLFKGLDKDTLLAQQYSYLGSAYYFSQFLDADLALSYYQKAYEMYDSLGMKRVAALNLNYSAYIHWVQGEKDTALNIHRQALSLFEGLRDLKGKTISTSDMGFTLNSLDDFEQGLYYNLKAWYLSDQLKDTLVLIPILNNIGISYQGLGKLDSALHFSLKSKTLAEERGLKPRQAEALKTLHSTYAMLSDHENAYASLLDYQAVNDSMLHKDKVRELLKLEYRLKQAREKHKQELLLRNEKYFRNTLIIILVFLILLLIFFIRNSRIKKRTGEIISRKNRDLTEINAKLEQQLRIKNLLIKEINHRIKNHFQMISSLNRLLYRDIENEEIQDIVNDINNRVQSMAEIYDHLNYSGEGGMNLKNYLTNISENLINSLQSEVQLELDLQDFPLDVKRTVNLGVVVTEMVTNSIKHAFKEQIQPVIRISSKTEHEDCIISVLDNGDLLRENILEEALSSQGIELIKLIVDQMHAQLHVVKEKGWNGWEIRCQK